MKEKIMLLDGHSIINRAFYGVPILTNAQGLYTNGVYGFLNILFKLLDEEKPDYTIVTFDLPKPTFRHELYTDYKGTRKKMPDELRPQVPLLKETLMYMKICICEKEGFEADDVLGTLAKSAEAMGMEPVIISGDRDLLQLASDKIKIRIPKTKHGKTETEDYYADDVYEKYGVTPIEYIEVKALMGDPSDNIPGVPGIGEVTAVKIIKEYHTIENAIANAELIKPKKASENLTAYREQAELSKVLATIKLDAPIAWDKNECITPTEYSQDAYQMLKRLEFKSLLSRIQFSEKKEERQKSQYSRISDITALQELLPSLSAAKTAAYFFHMDDNLLQAVSISFSAQESYYIELGLMLDEMTLFNHLTPFFSNPHIMKIAHDVKKDLHYVKDYGFKIEGVVMDVMIAGYLLNSLKGSYNYDDLSAEFLKETHVSESELFKSGKTRGRRKWHELSEDESLQFAAGHADVLFRLYPVMDSLLKEKNMQSLYYDIEHPLIFVLADMEDTGIRINNEELSQYGIRLQKKIDELTQGIYDLAKEEFNINSPKQLGVILFEKLGLKSDKKNKTGYSTSAEVLEKLLGKHDIIAKILEFRTYSKLKTTYVDGLLAVMDQTTHKIYTTFNQTIAATGRLSSTEPNLQNIPVRLPLGRELRKIFIPDGEEYVFIDADYSQIELRIMAHLAGDKTLIDAFNTGLDIHRLTASQVCHVAYEDVTQKQRSDAKAVNFGIIYGIGAFSLSQDLHITKKEADAYIQNYFDKYPKVREYLNKTVEDAKVNGYVSTIFGRVRPMPELSAGGFIQRSFGERVAMNMPVQGAAADIIKIAMNKVYQRLKDGGFKSRLLLQVHDELLIEAHEDEVESVKEILQHEMENCVSLDVKLEADVHTGKSWFDAK